MIEIEVTRVIREAYPNSSKWHVWVDFKCEDGKKGSTVLVFDSLYDAIRVEPGYKTYW